MLLDVAQIEPDNTRQAGGSDAATAIEGPGTCCLSSRPDALPARSTAASRYSDRLVGGTGKWTGAGSVRKNGTPSGLTWLGSLCTGSEFPPFPASHAYGKLAVGFWHARRQVSRAEETGIEDLPGVEDQIVEGSDEGGLVDLDATRRQPDTNCPPPDTARLLPPLQPAPTCRGRYDGRPPSTCAPAAAGPATPPTAASPGPR
jgi:hypothetical protein